jgi:peptidoglycan-associated lipoprotein
MVLTLGVAVFMTGIIGCSSKKQVVEAPKKEAVKPAPKKPEPPKVVPKTPERKEAIVPADLKFQTIYFDFDKSNIRSDQRSSLTKNAQLLNQYKTVKIRLEGHCDERGTEEYNMALGQRRADAVERFLSDYGISGSRITSISYGEMRPADSGHNDAAWAKNRRCELVITAK